MTFGHIIKQVEIILKTIIVELNNELNIFFSMIADIPRSLFRVQLKQFMNIKQCFWGGCLST